MERNLSVTSGDMLFEGCASAIVVPETALEEAGYIKTFTASQDANAKHEFQAMAQMVYYQVEDGELEPVTTGMPITVQCNGEAESMEVGMVVFRDGDGRFHVLIHNSLNRRKMLETANRYCTRWVRLDI